MVRVRFCSACGERLSSAPPVRCAACGVEHWHNAKPCANALVVDDGRVLLARRAHAPWAGLWAGPGGFVNAGEHPIAAAEREVFEEVGLCVEVTAYLGTWIEHYADQAGPDDEIINVAYYLARLAGPAAVTVDPQEVSDVGWFAFDDLPDGGPPGTFDAVIEAAQALLEGIHGLHDRPPDRQ